MMKGNVRYLRALTLFDDIFIKQKGFVRTAALVAFTTWIASATCIKYRNNITQVYFSVFLVLTFVEIIEELMRRCVQFMDFCGLFRCWMFWIFWNIRCTIEQSPNNFVIGKKIQTAIYFEFVNYFLISCHVTEISMYEKVILYT